MTSPVHLTRIYPNFEYMNTESLQYIIALLVGLGLLYLLVHYIMRRLGKDPRTALPVDSARKVRKPLLILVLSIFLQITAAYEFIDYGTVNAFLEIIGRLGIILAITWLVIIAIKLIKKRIINRYDVERENNLHARKVYTQFTLLERSAIFILILVAIGIALMSFNDIRAIGLGVLSSAGIAGIVLGFAAQKVLGTLLAGIQIAITQPIRYDDVVIVEGEWGRIEEITLTYVVVKIWDKRRLVLPSTYFIENPFQNWTRSSSDILGTVVLYLDYEVPLNKVREELQRIVEEAPQWDGEVANIQVTDTTQDTMLVRALVSAPDSSQAWELRVMVREKLIDFLQREYPESLPLSRVELRERRNDDNRRSDSQMDPTQFQDPSDTVKS